ncbi:hypothetical protein CR513_22506, partial [Mucuna pruriens]
MRMGDQQNIKESVNPLGKSQMTNEHPNLYQSHDECMKKGSENFGDRLWLVFDFDFEELKGFLTVAKKYWYPQ